MALLAKKIISITEGIMKKTYERCNYESVDEKPILSYVPKNDEKNYSGVKFIITSYVLVANTLAIQRCIVRI